MTLRLLSIWQCLEVLLMVVLVAMVYDVFSCIAASVYIQADVFAGCT